MNKACEKLLEYLPRHRRQIFATVFCKTNLKVAIKTATNISYIHSSSQFHIFITLITDVFPGTRKMERKEKPLKKSCQNPV